MTGPVAVQLNEMDAFWHRVRAQESDLRLGELLATLGAALVREAGVGASIALKEVLPAVCAGHDRLCNEIAHLSRHYGAALVMEQIWQRYLDAGLVHLPRTDESLAELMVRVAGVQPGDTVLDPACGSGSVLLAAHRAGAASLLGQDINPTAAAVAAARLTLATRGSATHAHLLVGDSLLADGHDTVQADVVLCEGPVHVRSWGFDELHDDARWTYGVPPAAEGELAWLSHCLARTAPGGTAVVVMPAAASSRDSGRRVRSNLLRAGVVRGVFALPDGAGTLGQDRHLWLLRVPLPGDRPVPAVVSSRMGDFAAITAAARAIFDLAAVLPPTATWRSVRNLLAEDAVLQSPAASAEDPSW